MTPLSLPASGRLLLRSPNWLGDAVMALPAVRALKQAHPTLALTVAAPAKLAALWRACPDVAQVVELERPRCVRTSVAALRRADVEMALLFPNSLRSALEARLAGIGRLVALRAPVRDWLVSAPVARRPFDPARLHQKYDYLHLVAALGADWEEVSSLPQAPLLRLREEDASLETEAASVILCPGAAYGPAKRWHAARFAEVGRKLAERGLGPIAVMGAGGDAEAAAEVAAAVPGSWNRAGQTPLEEFMEAIARARIVVTNDSGAMHLAAALGTPGVAVFGSTEPRKTGPISPCVRVVRDHVPCSPCFLRTCPLDFACMERVTVERVLGECETALAQGKTL